ncbi:Uncharacterized protein dnm_085290 [Desulfonema magnum]|uniref:Uncharacterized protein n=1 Tax=Desulfonema magnum TaxID=45655 RepID=A0A975BVE5_9BACT|nr:Uncharacterized protein dnm_085290 [Desulfonema magnum]
MRKKIQTKECGRKYKQRSAEENTNKGVRKFYFRKVFCENKISALLYFTEG